MVVERDYPATYERFTSIGPLMEKIGNGGKGIAWNTQSEIGSPAVSSTTPKRKVRQKASRMLNTAIDAAEMILTLAPETNGQVAVKAWAALSEFTGRDHTHLALNKEDEKIRFRDIQAQPRKIISSPTWSGLEERTRFLQRRLHQRSRADPVAHALWPSAAVSGSSSGCVLLVKAWWLIARLSTPVRVSEVMGQIPPNGLPGKSA